MGFNLTALLHHASPTSMEDSSPCGPTGLLTVACDPHGFYLALFVAIGLVVMAGMMAGLTMGLLSLDQLNLQILQTTGSDAEKAYATRLLPVVKQHHLLLVSLLLFNAIANEALPVFLARIVPDAYAVVISVSCVLFFGEIIPSAIFTGKQQLTIAATLVPLVRFLMWIALPLAWPVAKALDCVLGDDHDVSRYKRKELKALVALHHRKSLRQLEKDATKSQLATKAQSLPLLGKVLSSYDATTPLLADHDAAVPNAPALPGDDSQANDRHRPSMTSTDLLNDEVAIIHGAMDMSTKTVQMIMTPFDKVFMLDVEEKLNDTVMVRILASGYSRIPVYKGHRSNVVGLLLVKRLIVLNPADEKPLKHLMLRRPIVISPDHSCYSILNVFQEGRSHLALVTAQKDTVNACWKANTDIDPAAVEILGVVTIEDVLEEIIMEEIMDESDALARQPSNSQLVRDRGVQRAVEKFKALLVTAKNRRGKDTDAREATATSAVQVVIDE